MFAKWIRNLIANSLYWEIRRCGQCEMTTGFDNWVTCEKHKNHIDLHNTLTTINS